MDVQSAPILTDDGGAGQLSNAESPLPTWRRGWRFWGLLSLAIALAGLLALAGGQISVHVAAADVVQLAALTASKGGKDKLTELKEKLSGMSSEDLYAAFLELDADESDDLKAQEFVFGIKGIPEGLVKELQLQQKAPTVPRAGELVDRNVYRGSWVKGKTAGGCRNFIDTFWMNPQYKFKLNKRSTVIVTLMQKDREPTAANPAALHLTIGYTVYKAPSDAALYKKGQLKKKFFRNEAIIARSPVFIDSREVVGKHELDAGEYVVIPSTFDPDEEGKFLMVLYNQPS